MNTGLTNSITQNTIIYKDVPCVIIKLGDKEYLWDIHRDIFYEEDYYNVKKYKNEKDRKL